MMGPNCPACGSSHLSVSKFVWLDGEIKGHPWEQIHCLDCGCEWSPVGGKRLMILRLRAKDADSLGNIREAEKHLAQAGVLFSAYDEKEGNRVSARVWQLDWSLRQAEIIMELSD